MANKRVSLVRKSKTDDGWRRYPVAMSANGRVKPNAVIVGDVEKIYPIGHYELRSYNGRKLVWTRIEGGATEALAALKLAQKRANAVAMADEAGVQVVVDPTRTVLRDAAKRFVQAAQDRGSAEAAEVYQRTTDEFLDGCSKIYADELTNEDVLKFHVLMRRRGMSPRTISNRHGYLRSFLLSLSIDVNKVCGRAPKYDKTLPEIYEPDELKAFFLSLKTNYDRLLFELLLTTGLREAEAQHLEWNDISFSRRTLRVKSKPQYGHKIKDSEERELPLTRTLAVQLEGYRETLATHRLVFGKREGKEDAPDGHLLRRLKGLVKDAGLNCGSCKTCIESEHCENWWLHKFRSTYITKLLRSGMDLRTAMRLSGHSDLESVMRYLRPAGTDEVQDRVNAINWF